MRCDLRSKFKFAFVAIVVIGFAAPVQSEETNYKDVVNELNRLLTNKNFVQAYTMAESKSFEYGGEDDFDLLLGFAAFGSEHFQEAVFAFERVAVNRPTLFIGRFFLAKSYTKLGNYAAANVEIEKLLNTNLTPQQSQRLTQLQSQIEQQALVNQRSWYHVLGTNVSYDSNVNSGADLDTVVIPDIGEIVLFDSAKETSDIGYNISYMGGYRHPLDQNRTLLFDINASHYGYAENNEYQRQQLGLSVSYLQKMAVGQISISGFTRPLWLEQEVKSDTLEDLTVAPQREVTLYRIDSGLNAGFSQNFNKKLGYKLNGQFSFIGNEVSPELDFTRVKLSGSVQYKTQVMQTLAIHWQQDSSTDSDRGYNDKSVIGVTYQLALPINDKLISSSYVMYESHRFDSEHPMFKLVRDESIIALSSQLMYKIAPKQQVKLQLNLQSKDSNEEVFNFNRFESVLGWQYAF